MSLDQFAIDPEDRPGNNEDLTLRELETDGKIRIKASKHIVKKTYNTH